MIELAMIPRNTRVFDEQSCTRCGECFHQCPELQLPLAIAKKEITSLIDSGKSQYVLQHCTTCLSCNHICPHDCHPYQMILECWNNLYKIRGAPPIYRFVCPTEEGNIWQMLFVLMSENERKLVHEWMTAEPEGDVLLVGNYVHLLPFIVGRSKIFDRFTIKDVLDHWECGAYLYQGGYLDNVKLIAEKSRKDFQDWGKATSIVPMLDAVHWMLTGVFESELHVHTEQIFTNFHDWLLEAIDSGKVKLTRKNDFRVTVHDNCYSKAGGGQYWERPREIIRRTGCEIVEMKHVRENSLCCGFGAGASWDNSMNIVFDIMSVSKRKFIEAEATGADALVTYCGGCLYLLWAARELFGSRMDVFHLVELVRLAAGEKLDYPRQHVKRAWDLIAIITVHMAMSMIRKPFWIRKITLPGHQLEIRDYKVLRAARLLLEIPLARFVYKKVFLLMLPLLKSNRDWKGH